MERQQYITETVRMLRERYGATADDLLHAFHDGPRIPVTAFTPGLTPLQAITHYLLTHANLDRTIIAKTLGRPKSTIDEALQHAARKHAPTTHPADTPYTINAATLKRHSFTPGEGVVYALHTEHGLSNAQIAALIHRDPRNTHQLLTKAKHKVGGRP